MSGRRDRAATLACLRLPKTAELALVCCADRVGRFCLGAQPDWRACALSSLPSVQRNKKCNQADAGFAPRLAETLSSTASLQMLALRES